MNIFSTWLTANRACNLNCKWCYAQETDKNCNMNLDTAKKLIDISIDCKVKNFKLIGGEPTIYPNFFEVVEYIIATKASITIVTNGIRLADAEFCLKMMLSRLVDTFFSRTSRTMLLYAENHSISVA